MSEEKQTAPSRPTVHDDRFGEIVLHVGDEYPWITRVPGTILPNPIEIYLAGDAKRPDPLCLQLAASVLEGLTETEAACVRRLEEHWNSVEEKEWTLEWLTFAPFRDMGAALWEATFTLYRPAMPWEDTYCLWVVTLQDQEPVSIQEKYW